MITCFNMVYVFNMEVRHHSNAARLWYSSVRKDKKHLISDILAESLGPLNRHLGTQ